MVPYWVVSAETFEAARQQLEGKTPADAPARRSWLVFGGSCDMHERMQPTLMVYDGEVPADADVPLGEQRLLAELPLTLSRAGVAIRLRGFDSAANAAGVATFARVLNRHGVVVQVRDEELVLINSLEGSTHTIVTGMFVRTDFTLSFNGSLSVKANIDSVVAALYQTLAG